MLDIKTLESWLWDAACKIRGEIDAAKYKDYILPLVFLKRLSDVYDDELDNLAKEYKNRETAEKLVEKDHSLVWFYIPQKARWKNITKQTTSLGEYMTDAVRSLARENPKLAGVIDSMDFNATSQGQRIISDDSLKSLIDTLDRHRLGLADAAPDVLGQAYEYLLRKFAEGSGQSAGEFYTPKEVAILMAKMVEPSPGQEIYDPCLGSGGLLIKCYLRFKEKHGHDPKVKPLRFYGQEFLPTTLAMAKMNSFIHQMESELAIGDTMRKPAFKTATGALRKFDIVVANPMWNQDFDVSVYENDAFNRFSNGYPPASTADWGWIQHMFASLNDNGRMAVVLDTGAASRGSGNKGSNKERDIRKAFVEKDLVEAVLLMPDNLFYNTTAPGVIVILNRKKKHPGSVLLINGSKLFEKGRPKNFLPEKTCIDVISSVYHLWKEEKEISRIVSIKELIENDYNLSPSRYVAQANGETVLPLEEAVVLLKEAEEERAEADVKLKEVLKKMGLGK